MKIALIGSGGREHALAWKLAQSENCTHLYVLPGSDAIAAEDKSICIDIEVSDYDAILSFVEDEHIDLVVIGPEVPLVDGLADRLRAKNISVFGPSEKAAQLEGSKGFMKDLCQKYDIPTARYGRFTDIIKAKDFVKQNALPIVIKADGLAAGKGVIIAQNQAEAFEAIDDMLSGNAFGGAGASVVIEEFLEGEEVSFFALTDGKTILPLTSAQDHKRAYDGDKGPNTGGMGAYSPARSGIWDKALEEETMNTIIYPTVAAMKAEGAEFSGLLYAGLMIVDNRPYLIEYNVRFGDPECQPIMMRLQSDLAMLLKDNADEKLANWEGKLKWDNRAALCVVMAAKGYPGSYAKNTPILGLSACDDDADIKIFHAGTRRSDEDGDIWFSNGGRVLGVTALSESISAAASAAYEKITKINWLEGFFRQDIGWRAK